LIHVIERDQVASNKPRMESYAVIAYLRPKHFWRLRAVALNAIQ
jgi:hypothetical protein